MQRRDREIQQSVRWCHAAAGACRKAVAPRAAPVRTGAVTAALLAAALAQAAPAAPGPPPPGRYGGRLCVQPLQGGAGNCGPVDDLRVQRGGRASVRVSDIVYRLQLHSSQLDVVLMHGAMQIDEFTTFYEWSGSTLQFSDREKGLRYVVQFGERRQ